jgi:thiamine transport system substrate-binding protein
MKRRTFLRRAGAGSVLAGLAGCAGDDAGDGTTSTTTRAGEETTSTTTAPTTTTTGEPSGTLRVATYDSFTGEGTAGNWLKRHFEERYPDVTVSFTTPQNGINEFIQRRKQGAPIDPDLYVGLNTGELVRIDEELDTPLFAASSDSLERGGAVKDALRIDPQGRAIPYDTGYICLVYDEGAIEAPMDFDALLREEYRGDLLTENAQQSDPGRAFLLWSIIANGEDGYIDYWEQLLDNDVQILSDWGTTYQAYMDGEAPMVVSYSTDQVYYHGEGVDMSRHQIGFLNDQGYANPEGMAMFSDASQSDLARRFMDFMLTPEAQAAIAQRNVQFPAVEGVDLPEDFSQYAYEPPEPVTFTYDELAGNVESWIDDWARTVASA